MLKTKVPQRVKEATTRLKLNNDFKEILNWLEAGLEDTRKENDFLDGIDLTRSQGCAITLCKIVKTMKDLDD